eukprot:CCRYP_016396-RA/>CCRYP_016396-RA protein AED:0.26 eAED:0.26 QI:45/1/1/1/0.55/0.6/10/2293/648
MARGKNSLLHHPAIGVNADTAPQTAIQNGNPTETMVTIRNGPSYDSKSPSRWLRYLPQLISIFFVVAVSFYGGMLLGMHLNVNDSAHSTETSAASTTEDIDKRVEREVQRRMKLAMPTSESDGKKTGNKKKDKAKQSHRFPDTVKKFATGIALVSKNDFLANFDYGIPKPPSKREHESDPGKDDVLILYGGDSALPNTQNKDTAMYINDSEPQPPHFSAQEATANCGGLNVIFTDTHDGLDQCLAIVGNYESYHIQRWLRIDTHRSDAKLDLQKPLAPVGRGLQTNGMDKFSAPEDSHMMQNQELLRTYFDQLDETTQILKPMAGSCAGEDNTVIVMVCNTGQSDLLINFVCSADSRGFGDIVREKVLLFATDQGMLDIALGLGMKAFYNEKIFEKMPEKEAGRYGDKAFTQMMYAKVVSVQLINALGHDVLFQDVDLVWYKNPLPFFHDKSNPLYDFDMFFQDDGARSLRYAPYSANTGFYYVRNNLKTKFLFRALLYQGDMVLSMTSHQQALAALLDEHSSLTGLRVKTLSGVDFPGGYHYHRKKEIEFMKDIVTGKHVPFLMHMSWTTNKDNKLLFLKQMGLWYVNEKCESGGGVDEAKNLSGGAKLDSACCSVQPLISCHFRDKPSIIPCDDSKMIDAKGKPFW